MGQPAEPLRQRGPRLVPTRTEDGLAEVIRLDAHRRRRLAPRVYLRRRIVVGMALVLLVALAIVGVGRIAATAGPEELVGGHDVVAPGETLWDLAAEHAPRGTDPRGYLEEVIELNGFDRTSVPAWTVVLLPRD